MAKDPNKLGQAPASRKHRRSQARREWFRVLIYAQLEANGWRPVAGAQYAVTDRLAINGEAAFSSNALRFTLSAGVPIKLGR